MLPKGTISRVLDYFTASPSFAPAFEEAACDFFEIEDPAELATFVPSKLASDYFNEWLAFDMELDTRRTLLQEYLFLEHGRLSTAEKKMYTDLVLTQRYSLFRCDAVNRGIGLTMYDLLTDQSYEVTEYTATFQAKVGDYSFMRLAQVNGWHIVSADGYQIPPAAIPDRMLRDWQKRKIKFNPLVVYQQMFKGLEESMG